MCQKEFDIKKIYLNGFFDVLDNYKNGITYNPIDSQWGYFLSGYTNELTDYLSSDYILEANKLLNLPEASFSLILETCLKIKASSELKGFYNYCCELFFDSKHKAVENTITEDKLIEFLGGNSALFPIFVLFSGIPRISAYYKFKGISENILVDTLSDIRVWMINSYKRYGVWGMAEFRWLLFHFNGILFKLGRLQFMKNTFEARLHIYRNVHTGKVIALSEAGVKYRRDGFVSGTNGIEDTEGGFEAEYSVIDNEIIGNHMLPSGVATKKLLYLSTNDYKEVLKKGDTVIDLHIQEGGKMDFAECGQSFSEAIEFYLKYFPDIDYKGFTCTSWLLDPQLKLVLSDASNIIKFQKEFYLYPIFSDDHQTMDRVFGSRFNDLNAAPTDTSLQKKIVEIMKTGKRFQEGGMFLLPEDFSWGNKTVTSYSDEVDPKPKPRTYAIELSASVSKDPPQIKLVWTPNSLLEYTSSLNNYKIYRKLFVDMVWDEIAELPGSAQEYVDKNIKMGTAYEYLVSKGNIYNGYLYSGIEIPLVENRGKIILIVDSSFSVLLSEELSRLEQDLIGDGWEIIRHDVLRNSKDYEVKKLIKEDYSSDPDNIKGVFLIGHVPVPYSGLITPDGHPDHYGAWPADVFYGDMKGEWTDTIINDTSSDYPANRNVPGDGKYDQSEIPEYLSLFVGRVDFYGMEEIFTQGEAELLRQYLNKDHNFRHKLVDAERRGLVRDNFAHSVETFSTSGWRNFATFFGSENVFETDDYFETLKNDSYLWAYGCGPGSFHMADGVGKINQFNEVDTKAVFNILFGSYFGDWNCKNNFMKGPLCTKTYGLISFWSGRPQWFLQHMALGETIGFSTKLSLNSGRPEDLYNTECYEGVRGVHSALMGDPTLRMHVVAPPSKLFAVKKDGTANLKWSGSQDNVVGYNVYRSKSPSNNFEKINTELIEGTEFYFTENLTGNITYMVKAVKLEASASGTYYNASQGVFLADEI